MIERSLVENPNRVTTRVDENDEPTGVTTTPVELAGDAYAACIVAATYPSDTAARFVAIQACGALGVSYIDAVAIAAEKLRGTFDLAHLSEARFYIADEFRVLQEDMRKHGGLPREGILTSGRPANDQGFADPDYGSLA